MTKFNGANGRKPSTEARHFVYARLARLLEDELDENQCAGWLYMEIDADEFDRRRIRAAAKKVAVELQKKAAR